MKLITTTLFALTTLAAAPASAQVMNPANGSFYQAVSAPLIRWDTARDAAAQASFMISPKGNGTDNGGGQPL